MNGRDQAAEEFQQELVNTGGLKGSYGRGVTNGDAGIELTDLRKAKQLIKRKAVPTDLAEALSC